jgi:hypothetical protein
MCTVPLPPGVYPIAVDKYININPSVTSSFAVPNTILSAVSSDILISYSFLRVRDQFSIPYKKAEK